MIFHHVKALSRISSKYKVSNIYLVGPYPSKKFRPFLDEVNSTFDFERVEYIESQKLSRGMGVCGAVLSLLEKVEGLEINEHRMIN